MSKKLLIVFSVILIVVGTGLFWYFNYQSGTKENSDTDEVRDCGSTNPTTSYPEFYKKIEKDETLVCMGDSIINGCINAKSIVLINSFENSFLIMGTNEEDCRFRINYTKDAIVDTQFEMTNEESLQYEGMYVECNIRDFTSDIILSGEYYEEKSEEYIEQEKNKALEVLLNNPSKYAYDILFHVGFILAFSEKEDDWNEFGCEKGYY